MKYNDNMKRELVAMAAKFAGDVHRPAKIKRLVRIARLLAASSSGIKPKNAR